MVPGCAAYDEKVSRPGGFVLPHPPRDSRTFDTEVGKAVFTTSPTDVLHVPEGRLLLQTMRSHDQFNTTIYGLDDRYRGIKNGRRVVFVHPDDITALGLADGSMVDLVSEWSDGSERRAPLFRVVPYDQPRGCAAAYYPETNPLIPLGSTAIGSNCPTSKSVIVRLEPPGGEQGVAEPSDAGSVTAGDNKRTVEPEHLVMSNLEEKPPELDCRTAPAAGVEIMTPRDVPLGGPRAMRVRRTLPQRERSLIGAWCFVDHYGPDEVADSGGMVVPPHPHTGLQTVSWLFTGEVEHRDSAGHHAMVRPGEVNLMTAGRGISHSEVSPPTTTTLHGAQLWVALPDSRALRRPDLRPPRAGAGDRARLRGPGVPRLAARRHLAGLDVHPAAGRRDPARRPAPRSMLDVDPTFEHGVLVDAGVLSVAGVETKRNDLAYVPPGSARSR